MKDAYRYENGTWVKILLEIFRRDSRKPHFIIKLPTKGAYADFTIHHPGEQFEEIGTQNSQKKQARFDWPVFKWSL